MRETWLGYDAIADIYEYDMGHSIPFDDVGYYVYHAAQLGGEVLDLGCGTGRISLALLKAQLSVTAVDASGPMLQRLQAARASLPLSEARRLTIVQMDLRQWALHAKFTTILCPYSLLTYFVEQQEYFSVLKSIRESLVFGGQFICDIFVPKDNLPYGQLLQDYQRRLPDGSLLIRSKVVATTASPGVHEISRHYERSWGAYLQERFATNERIRHWYPEALKDLLENHSFHIVARDFDYGFSNGEVSPQFVTFRCCAPAR